jgi:hypothetical protein
MIRNSVPRLPTLDDKITALGNAVPIPRVSPGNMKITPGSMFRAAPNMVQLAMP